MLSPLKTTLFTLLLALTCAAGSAASAQAATVGIAPFKFNGVEYVHRSSEGDQHEFTPRSQSDLRTATDGIILLRHTNIVDGEVLAAAAKESLEAYKKQGARVVTHTTVPRTAEKPGEYLIAVILSAPEEVEASFLRLTTEGATIYSHRIYGQSAEKAMSAWMEKNGAAMEKALMSWENIPFPAAAKTTLTASSAAVANDAAKKLAPLKFNGVEFTHRSSADDAHDFMPRDQLDVQNWTDMITLRDEGEDLAATAKAALEFYKKQGARVVTHLSVPGAAEKPAEYLITVILGSRESFDAIFFRLGVAVGVSSSMTYCHRIVGDSAEKAMTAWMEKNGAAIEKALMSSESISIPAAAKTTHAADAPATSTKAAPKLASFKFHGAEYVHRWSQDDQHEFTPHGQEDLQKWTQMMTLHRYPKVVDRQSQDAAVGAIIENYKRHGGMIHTFQPVPATKPNPAEYSLIVVLRGPGFMEAAFARFKLVDGIGASAIYSHRIYGEAALDRIEPWMKENSETMEKALLSWEIPAPAVANK